MAKTATKAKTVKDSRKGKATTGQGLALPKTQTPRSSATRELAKAQLLPKAANPAKVRKWVEGAFVDAEDQEAGRILAEHNAEVAAERAASAPREPVVTGTTSLPVGSIFPSILNPRRKIDEEATEELAVSIVANGVLQALLVRPLVDEHIKGEAFEIICGERRWRAASKAVFDGRLPADFQMPVRVRLCTDEELVVLATTENLQRKDMDPLDEAAAFQNLGKVAQRLAGERTAAAVARILGIGERTVFRRLHLLRLAPELQADLREGKINLAQADAYSRADAKTQLAHRKQAEKAPLYEGRVDRIESNMTSKRIAVDRALFDLASYTGEILTDPADDEQYFADTAMFKRLNDAAVDAKVAELAKKYPWAKRIPDNKLWDYDAAEKGNAKAGAIVYLDYHGKLVVKAPVTERAQRETTRSAPTESYEERELRIAKLRAPYVSALCEAPLTALAFDLAQAIENAGKIEEGSYAAKALAPLSRQLRAALRIDDAADLLEAIDAIGATDDDEDPAAVRLFRMLVDQPAMSTLLPLWTALHLREMEREITDWQGNISPLARALLEPGLPFGTREKAAAE